LQTHHQQYRQNDIHTASPEKLLLMLYTGAIKNLNLAERGLDDGSIERVNLHLGKTQDIISELMASLDFSQGPIGEQLYQLYEYMYSLLVEANVKKDRDKVAQVREMLIDLRNAWRTVCL
jgi:flagellar secretion chaperone FliS